MVLISMIKAVLLSLFKVMADQQKIANFDRLIAEYLSRF
jgi:hypothetical protein